MITRRAFVFALIGSPEVLTIPKASMPRAETECELITALRKDVENLHAGLVDWKLRKRIAHLTAELSAEV